MRVAIISGGHTAGSQSARVADYLRGRLMALPFCGDMQVGLHDLGAEPLPLWHPGASELTTQQANLYSEAEAYILVSPEYHGMASPAIKNWFFWVRQAWLEHKPALLVGVSGGQGGVYPVMELRAHTSKNFRLCYLPDHLVIQRVQHQFPVKGDIAEPLGRRIDYCLRLLATYTKGFVQMRSELPERPKACTFGM